VRVLTLTHHMGEGEEYYRQLAQIRNKQITYGIKCVTINIESQK